MAITYGADDLLAIAYQTAYGGRLKQRKVQNRAQQLLGIVHGLQDCSHLGGKETLQSRPPKDDCWLRPRPQYTGIRDILEGSTVCHDTTASVPTVRTCNSAFRPVSNFC